MLLKAFSIWYGCLVNTFPEFLQTSKWSLFPQFHIKELTLPFFVFVVRRFFILFFLNSLCSCFAHFSISTICGKTSKWEDYKYYYEAKTMLELTFLVTTSRIPLLSWLLFVNSLAKSILWVIWLTIAQEPKSHKFFQGWSK